MAHASCVLVLSLLSTIRHPSSEASCFSLLAVNKTPPPPGPGAASRTPTPPGRGALGESLGSQEDVQIGLPRVSMWLLVPRPSESGGLALPDCSHCASSAQPAARKLSSSHLNKAPRWRNSHELGREALLL